MSEVFRVIEPEPLLIRFLGKFTIDASVIAGEEIDISAVTPQNERRRAVRRTVTIDEINQAERWLKGHPEIVEDIPLVHVNMELLRGQRAKMPLSSKPLL